MQIHNSAALDRVLEATERHLTMLYDPGFCICCGKGAEGVEPDAHGYICEACDELGVYCAEELVIIMP